MVEQAVASLPQRPMPAPNRASGQGFARQSTLSSSGRAETAPRVLHGTVLPSLLDEPMLELELALAHFDRSQGFRETIEEAARGAGGELLFDLPASGLLPDCRRIAALRVPNHGGPGILFACLDLDGETIRIEAPDEKTHHLQEFAEAFVGVLERM